MNNENRKVQEGSGVCFAIFVSLILFVVVTMIYFSI